MVILQDQLQVAEKSWRQCFSATMEKLCIILPISSIKMMEGWSFIAREKTAAASFWDSPYHLSVSVEGWRLINRQPASFAVALAINVLPQPGGP